MTELTALIVGLGLVYASIRDLKTRKVKDKVWFYTLIPVFLVASLQVSPAYAGSMLIQGVIMLLIGLGISLAAKFGGADVLALAVAGSQFPNVLSFRLAALLLVPMLVFMKAWSILTRSREVPAVPAILFGYIICVAVFI